MCLSSYTWLSMYGHWHCTNAVHFFVELRKKHHCIDDSIETAASSMKELEFCALSIVGRSFLSLKIDL